MCHRTPSSAGSPVRRTKAAKRRTQVSTLCRDDYASPGPSTSPFSGKPRIEGTKARGIRPRIEGTKARGIRQDLDLRPAKEAHELHSKV